MIKDNKLTPNESIEIIETMLKEGRQRFTEDGKIYVFWGLLILIASIAHFFLIKIIDSWWMPFLIWGGVLLIGFCVVWFYFAKKPKRKKHYFDVIVKTIWIGNYINLALLMTLFFLQKIELSVYFAVLCFVLGSVYWALSVLVKFPFMRILAAFWWLGGLLCTITPIVWNIIILCLLLIICEIIPGIIMIVRYPQEK